MISSDLSPASNRIKGAPRNERTDPMSRSSNFPDSYILLQQEGHLIHTCLAAGLTKLRNSHVHNKGEFYAALFNLSIGTERLLKAILIMHHMLRNDLAVPTKGQLKAFGHNLISLYATCAEISVNERSRVPPLSALHPITREVLELLSDFAQTTRYHNLDALSSSSASKDPLHHFDEILHMVLTSDVPKRTVQKIVKSRSQIAAALSDISMIVAQGLDGSDLTLEQGVVLPALHEKAVRHVVLRVVQLLTPLKELIDTLSRMGYKHGPIPPFPQMHEFIEFLWDDRKYVLRKKKWP